MTDLERALLAWIEGQRDAMVALLARLVNTDSGSYDKAGVDATGAILSDFLADHGIATETLPVDGFGDTLIAGTTGVRRNNGRHNILLMGHRDTVFPKGEALRRPFHIAGDRAYGPGVADMKGGLVMNAFVVAAVRHLAPEVPLIAMMTGDEEIGSQASLGHIRSEAALARAVFNAEPARPTGNFVSGRKGGFTYRVDVTGKAAHAGVNFTEGASAIGELARKITALHALTDVEHGITLNVGLASGGSSTNTVAAKAMAEVDVRFVDREQRERLVAEIERILGDNAVPGTVSSFERQSESLPLAPTSDNARLSALYQAAAASLGLTVSGEYTGGCADSGIASSAGAPTVCGTGPVGGKAHTEDEYIITDTLVERAAVVALSVARVFHSRAG